MTHAGLPAAVLALLSVLDTGGRVRHAAPPLDEVVAAGGSLWDTVHPEDAEPLRAAWAQLDPAPQQAGAIPVRVRLRAPQAETDWRWFGLKLCRSGDAVLVSAADVTAAVEAERTLAVHAAALDALPIEVAISDEAGRFRVVNRGYCEHYGFPREQLLGQPFTMIIQPAERARWMAWHRGIIDGKPEPGREAPVVDHAGRTHFVAVTAERLSLPDGRRLRMTTLSDVTERRRVRERKELLAAVVANAPMVTCVIEPSGVVSLLEGRGAASLRLGDPALVGRPAVEVFASAPELCAALMRALGGEPCAMQLPFRGRVFDVWLAVSKTESGAVERVVGAALDVTAAARARAALVEQLDTVAAQQAMIRKLMLPVLPLWPGVLCVPLLGEAEEVMGDELVSTLLHAVQASRARQVLVDLTGIGQIHDRLAQRLLSMVRAVELLGARALVTGVRPQVARALVTLGRSLDGLRVLPTLHDGLRACLGER